MRPRRMRVEGSPIKCSDQLAGSAKFGERLEQVQLESLMPMYMNANIRRTIDSDFDEDTLGRSGAERFFMPRWMRAIELK